MKITRVKPSGYCYGVVNAINIVLNAVHSDCPKPITVYGMLIHNKNVTDALSKLGIVSLDKPKKSDIDNLNGTIVFTAHGTKESIVEYAKSKGLHVVNAICKDVTKTITLIKEQISLGKEVLYIGKPGHPEAVASTAFEGVHLINSKDFVIKDKEYVITNQTTMSIIELKDLYNHYSKFPNVQIMNEVCNATRRRQEAVIKSSNVDLLIVVGDKRSNNSNNLARLHKNGILIESYMDLKKYNLDYEEVAITAGASTPRYLVDEVVKYLEDNTFERDLEVNEELLLK